MVKEKYGCHVGVSRNTYSGKACDGKRLDAGCGYKSQQDGDVITVILNFMSKKVTFLRNGSEIKERSIYQGQTYYPASERYSSGSAVFKVV